MMVQFVMIVLLSGLLCVHVTSEQIENNRTDNIETSVDSRTVQSIDRTPESKLVAPDHFSFKQKYKELKKSGMIYVILAFEILLLLIFVGAVVGVIYSCSQYFKLKREIKDAMLRMEEGLLSSDEYPQRDED